MRKTFCIFCLWALFLSETVFAEELLVEKHINVVGKINAVDLHLEFAKENIIQHRCAIRLTEATGIFHSKINSEINFDENYVPVPMSWLECDLDLDTFVEGMFITSRVNLLAHQGARNEMVLSAKGPQILKMTPFFNSIVNRKGGEDTSYRFGIKRSLFEAEDVSLKMEGSIERRVIELETKEYAKLLLNMDCLLMETEIRTKIYFEKNRCDQKDGPESVGISFSLLL